MHTYWKKILKLLFSLPLILLLLLLALYLICPLINDAQAAWKEKQIVSSLEIPSDTVVAESVSGCGNTSGTGNHAELFIAVLLKTELDETQLLSCFPDAEKAGDDNASSLSILKGLGLSFSTLEGLADKSGYYILSYTQDAAASGFDLRGH